MAAESSFVDRAQFPDKLTAWTVDAAVRPSLFGYDVEADVARHYGFCEAVLLALTGELPTREQGRAAEVAMVVWLPAFIGEAPAHAAALAKLCGGRSSGVLIAGAATLAEESRHVVQEHLRFIAWLGAPTGEAPEPYRSESMADVETLSHLRAALAPMKVPALELPLTRDAAVIALLHAAGLSKPEQFETLLTVGRLPGVMAEALAVTPGRLRDYPMNLPAFDYRGER